MGTLDLLVIEERKCHGVYSCFPGDRGEEMSECVLSFPW